MERTAQQSAPSPRWAELLIAQVEVVRVHALGWLSAL
jgi:hypothetical protein